MNVQNMSVLENWFSKGRNDSRQFYTVMFLWCPWHWLTQNSRADDGHFEDTFGSASFTITLTWDEVG